MNRRLTWTRLVLAVISTSLEELAIWAVWHWVLPDLGFQLPWWPMIVIMVVWAGVSTWLFIFTTRTLRRQSQAGLPSMIGTTGVVASALRPEGMVKIKGELWRAVSRGGDIGAGVKIVVMGEDGLELSVREADGTEPKR